MIEVGVLKTFDSGTYKAGVQLAGSLTTYFDDISVARNIPSSAMAVGNYVIVAIPGGNPKDACVIAAWPQGSPGGGAFLDLSDTPSGYEGQADKVPRVNSGESALEFVGSTLLPDLVRQSNFIMIPTVGGWTEDNAGSGSITFQPMRLIGQTGVTPDSRGLCWTSAYGFNEGGVYQYMNWDKVLYFIFNVSRYQSDTEVVGRIQLKPGATEGPLAGKGIGLEILNGNLWGESYGTGLGEVDLGYTLNIAGQEGSQIVIALDPGASVKWYVNRVLKGTQSTASKIPTGTAIGRLVFSISNGATGGTNCALSMMQSKIWQEP
jgi:hypothetical protein